MEEDRTRCRSFGRVEASDASVRERRELPQKHSELRGYPELDFARLSNAKVVGILKEGERVSELAAGDTGQVVTDLTVFYPEGGGQVADTGTWRWPGGEASVTDTQQPLPRTIARRVT